MWPQKPRTHLSTQCLPDLSMVLMSRSHDWQCPTWHVPSSRIALIWSFLSWNFYSKFPLSPIACGKKCSLVWSSVFSFNLVCQRDPWNKNASNPCSRPDTFWNAGGYCVWEVTSHVVSIPTQVCLTQRHQMCFIMCGLEVCRQHIRMYACSWLDMMGNMVTSWGCLFKPLQYVTHWHFLGTGMDLARAHHPGPY